MVECISLKQHRAEQLVGCGCYIVNFSAGGRGMLQQHRSVNRELRLLGFMSAAGLA